MLLNDLKKAALCVAAGFAVTMFGGCDSQKSTGALAGAGAQRAPGFRHGNSADRVRHDDDASGPHSFVFGR